MKKKIINDQSGFALPMVLVAIAIFSILGVMVAHYVSSETLSARQTKDYLEARYVAEAGAEQGLFQIKKQVQGLTYNAQTGFQTYNWPALTNPSSLATYIDATPITAWTAIYANGSATPYGYYKWSYDASDPDQNTYTWANLANQESSTWPSSSIHAFIFHRTLIGQGKIILPDGTEVIRKIKVGVRISFLPLETPDSPVYITVTNWQDLYS